MKKFIQIVMFILLIGCFAPGLWAADMTSLIKEGVKDLKSRKEVSLSLPSLMRLTQK